MNTSQRISLIAGILVFAIIVVTLSGILSGQSGQYGPPPEIMAGWYLPHKSIYLQSQANESDSLSNEHLVLTGWYTGSPRTFPDISLYSRYENYTLSGSADRYQIAVWYFPDDTAFNNGRQILNEYLESHGTLSPYEFCFSQQEDSERIRISGNISCTKYESTDSSGFFLLIDRPLLSSREDRIVLYLGTDSPKIRSGQIPVFERLIAESFADRHQVSVEPF